MPARLDPVRLDAPNHAGPRSRVPLSRRLWSSVAPLGVLALLSTPGMGQSEAPAEKKPDNLGPVIVTAPQPKPARRVGPATQGNRTTARVPGRPRPQTAIVIPAAADVRGESATPLNSNVVTEVGSRLGLTPRQTPATVEVIDKQTIEDRGLRTITDIAKAATGVTGGDAPGAPAI